MSKVEVQSILGVSEDESRINQIIQIHQPSGDVLSARYAKHLTDEGLQILLRESFAFVDMTREEYDYIDLDLYPDAFGQESDEHREARKAARQLHDAVPKDQQALFEVYGLLPYERISRLSLEERVLHVFLLPDHPDAYSTRREFLIIGPAPGFADPAKMTRVAYFSAKTE